MTIEDFDFSTMKRCRLNSIQERDMAVYGVEYRTVDGSVAAPGLFFHKETDRMVGAVIYSVGAQCQVLNWKATIGAISDEVRKISLKSESKEVHSHA